ncbi:BAHD acyltransferase DCR [Acorus calamus]|uniref:BAHD acyltransferase DCR n=1 Tax=Acorus calamus TaxID=4465 RepID=A0AAV9CLE9_ACOCL|nr:BAHD acyltransferase DCR [Acorus calamus]
MTEEKPRVAVKVTGKSRVLPCKKEERRPTCQLVTFDLPYITFYYNQKVLVYKHGGDFGEAVGKLKEGLSAALEEFYPLAGRLGKDEEGVLVVKCGGEEEEGWVGVDVVEAVAEEVEVAELAADEVPELLQQIVPLTGVMNLEGLHRPLLAVQFTKLKDGFAIGCAFNHAILDGNSTWHFMSSWAEICRTGCEPTSISLKPIHDRTKARNTRVKLELPKSASEHEDSDPTKGHSIPLRERVFTFSEASIDKIKSDANAGRPEEAKPFSAFQSLGSHIWKAVCRARGLKPEDVTVFAIFMDCRKRVDPPMDDSYFGNLIQAVFTGTASGLGVIDVHDAKAIDARSKEWEAAPKLFHFKDAGVNCVAVGSSPRFPVYEVDFGFGRPERVRSGSNNKFDGMVYLYRGREGGRSVDVEITLEPLPMENLEKDEEFLKV